MSRKSVRIQVLAALTAAAVSTGVVIAGYGLLSDTASAIAMIAATLTLAIWVQRRKPQMPVYGLTVIWALAGIVMANAGLNPTIAILAGLGIAAMALVLRATLRA